MNSQDKIESLLYYSALDGPNSEDNIADSSQNPDGLKKPKKRKKKVEMACVYCRRSHMICDDARPCLRCIKRGIGHLCHDEPTQGRQKKKPPSKGGYVSPSTGPVTDFVPSNIAPDASQSPNVGMFNQNIQAQQPQQQKNGNSTLTKTLPFNHEPFFYSEHAGSEFSSLNDFLSMIDDPELVNGALNEGQPSTDSLLAFLITPGQGNSTTNFNSLLSFSPGANQVTTFPDQTVLPKAEEQPQNQNSNVPETNHEGSKQHSSSQKGSSSNLAEGHQPVISDSARDKFFLTAADPTTEISPEERLKQVIKAKLEAGLLQPYNYAKGYARLQNYMDNYMNQSSRQRILKPLLIFRPAFRAIARTLKDVDLVLVEESFERMLLDYDRVFTSMAIPACLWRRTGEIYRGNKEFASLVGVTTDDLKDGKLAIYELMSEESAVNFWEKYGAIAFDKGQKAVLTSCNLRTKDGFKRKSCCFSFTIRRDRYNIPSCIVGNFIPTDP